MIVRVAAVHLLAVAACVAQIPEPDDAERRAFSPPKSVSIKLEDPGHEALREQAAAHVKALLDAAGYSTTPVGKSDLEVKVVVRRKAIKATYMGAGERFSGAEIEGTWTWKAAGDEHSFAFTGRFDPPVMVEFRAEGDRRIGFETEALAPFVAAFVSSNLTLEFLREQKRLASVRSIQVLGKLARRYWCSTGDFVGLWIDEKDSDPLVGRTLAEDWIYLGKKLISGGTRSDEARLRELTRALETLRPASAVAEAQRVLKESTDWGVRAEAAELLGMIGGPESVPVLLELFADADSIVGGSAMRACGKLRAAEAYEPLLKVLGDPKSPCRADAARALGDLGDRRAYDDLLRFLEVTKGLFRGFGAEALGKLGDVRAVEPLANEIKSADALVRAGAARGLGAIEDSRVASLLAPLLADPERRVRSAAIDAFVARRDERCLDALVKDLDDRDLAVAADAASGLERLRSPRAVPALIRRLEFPDTNRFGPPGWEGPRLAEAALIGLTGQSFGTGPTAAIHWREWWDAQKGLLPGK